MRVDDVAPPQYLAGPMVRDMPEVVDMPVQGVSGVPGDVPLQSLGGGVGGSGGGGGGMVGDGRGGGGSGGGSGGAGRGGGGGGWGRGGGGGGGGSSQLRGETGGEHRVDPADGAGDFPRPDPTGRASHSSTSHFKVLTRFCHLCLLKPLNVSHRRRSCQAEKRRSVAPLARGEGPTGAGGADAAAGKFPSGGWARVQADAAKHDAVREAMRHAFEKYEQFAMGYDELQPLTRKGKNSFGGMGATAGW